MMGLFAMKFFPIFLICAIFSVNGLLAEDEYKNFLLAKAANNRIIAQAEFEKLSHEEAAEVYALLKEQLIDCNVDLSMTTDRYYNLQSFLMSLGKSASNFAIQGSALVFCDIMARSLVDSYIISKVNLNHIVNLLIALNLGATLNSESNRWAEFIANNKTKKKMVETFINLQNAHPTLNVCMY